MHTPRTGAGRMSQRRLLIIGLVAMNLIVMAYSLTSLFQARQRYDNGGKSRVENTGRLLADTMRSSFERVDYALQAAVDETEEQLLEGHDLDTRLPSFLQRQVTRFPDIGALSVTDRTGRHLLSIGSTGPARSPRPARFRGDENALLLDGPVSSTADPAPVLILSRPYHRPDGSPAGRIEATVPLDKLADRMRAFQPSIGGVVGLLLDNTPLIVQPQGRIGLPDARNARILASAPDGWLYQDRTSATPRLIGLQHLGKLPLATAFGVAESYYLTRWYAERNQTLSLLAVFMTTSLLLGLGLLRIMNTAELNRQRLLTRSLQLDMAQRVAGLGSFEWLPASNRLEWSDEHYRLWGLEPRPDAINHTLFLERIHPDDTTRVRAALRSALETGQPYDCTFRVVHPDGRLIWLRGQGEVIRNETGEPVKVVGTVLNITALKAAEEQIRQKEERLKLVLKGTRDGFWDWDLREGQIYHSSQEWRMLGYEEEPPGKDPARWMAMTHPDDLRRARKTLLRALAHRNSSSGMVEYRIRHADGHYIDILSRFFILRDENGRAIRVAGANTDITERKQQDARIRQMAYHDPLTQLPNRRLLMLKLEQYMAGNRRNHKLGALMFLDLDNFKTLNDRYGHDIGDQLLVEASHRLKASLRETDTVARLGGDEFIVVASDLDEDRQQARQAAGKIAELIRTVLSEPYHLAIPGNDTRDSDCAITFQCAASIGIALFDGHTPEAEELIRKADTAMYMAKNAGRGQIRFDPIDAQPEDTAQP